MATPPLAKHTDHMLSYLRKEADYKWNISAKNRKKQSSTVTKMANPSRVSLNKQASHEALFTQLSLGQICQAAGIADGACHRQRERNLPQGDPTIQEARIIDFGRMTAVSADRNRSQRFAWNRRGEVQKSVYCLLLSIWHTRLAQQNRRTDSCRRGLWPHCTRFIFNRNRMQRINA